MKQTKIETAYGTQLLQRIKLEVSVMRLRPRHLPGMPIACRRIWAILPILSLEPAANRRHMAEQFSCRSSAR
jgi:hypothetical protein